MSSQGWGEWVRVDHASMESIGMAAGGGEEGWLL